MNKKVYTKPQTEVSEMMLDVSMMQSTGGGGGMPPVQDPEEFSRSFNLLDDEQEVKQDVWAF